VEGGWLGGPGSPIVIPSTTLTGTGAPPAANRKSVGYPRMVHVAVLALVTTTVPTIVPAAPCPGPATAVMDRHTVGAAGAVDVVLPPRVVDVLEEWLVVDVFDVDPCGELLQAEAIAPTTSTVVSITTGRAARRAQLDSGRGVNR